MTLEDITGTDNTSKKMQPIDQALEKLLVTAQRQGFLTVGVYESAKLMNVDPDSVVLCLLAADEEDEGDIALQIHFTLIQAFCCENDINIVRLRGVKRLEELLETGDETAEPRDIHCMLVTNSHTDVWKCEALEEVGSYCEESRNKNQWVPTVSLQER
ncbi:growth arrest and DNA damage-inducible protein GADD45 beta-like [Chiloscyllium plagiosum]|uniref:growth arrest and DNA damage-inducible protein GADD45 beta-like n=1 Tax=Chiloscyllium plagiosum TaxID=36176 RepID=UPI001CB84592|nr:growth arrest and DNA damage-inducible protein GADD45 beta-like [Chiloscyllium plagiosum]XP_060701880.1 growth arrest and DNA damage-inducible protein GADD45 beta-like [Hemiscyllium ocellatum]